MHPSPKCRLSSARIVICCFVQDGSIDYFQRHSRTMGWCFACLDSYVPVVPIQAEFQGETKWFSDKRKKRARFPDGVAFEENTLAITANWVHEGRFARSGSEAVISSILMNRISHDSDTIPGQKARNILDNPLLKQIHENLSIVENQWIVEFPNQAAKRTQLPDRYTPWLRHKP